MSSLLNILVVNLKQNMTLLEDMSGHWSIDMLVLEMMLEKAWTRAQRLSATWCVLEIRHVELKYDKTLVNIVRSELGCIINHSPEQPVDMLEQQILTADVTSEGKRVGKIRAQLGDFEQHMRFYTANNKLVATAH